MGVLDEAAIASLSAFLEESWSDEFAEALADDQDATLGFALARAMNRGWVTIPSEPNVRFIAAAENFKETVGDL